MQGGHRPDGSPVVIGGNGHIVSLCDGRHFADGRNAIEGQIRAEDVHHLFEQQILEVSGLMEMPAKSQRRDALRRNLPQRGEIGNTAGFIEPEQVKTLERVSQAGGAAVGVPTTV